MECGCPCSRGIENSPLNLFSVKQVNYRHVKGNIEAEETVVGQSVCIGKYVREICDLISMKQPVPTAGAAKIMVCTGGIPELSKVHFSKPEVG